MRKLLKKISDWWNYTVLKKSHTEVIIVYSRGVNKKNQIYYFKDTFTVIYNGKNEISRTRVGRAFVNKQEFYIHNKD